MLHKCLPSCSLKRIVVKMQSAPYPKSLASVVPDIKASEKSHVDVRMQNALFVILGGHEIPEIPFGVLSWPRPARRGELQMVEHGCEGLTRPVRHPAGGLLGDRLSLPFFRGSRLHGRASCPAGQGPKPRAGVHALPGPRRVRGPKMARRPRLELGGGCWKPFRQNLWVLVMQRGLACRRASSVLDRAPVAAGVQARLPRERGSPRSFQGPGQRALSVSRQGQLGTETTWPHAPLGRTLCESGS